MSLEQLLAENTAALTENTAALLQLLKPGAGQKELELVDEAPVVKVKTKPAKTKAAPKKEEAPAETTEEAPTISKDDLANAVKAQYADPDTKAAKKAAFVALREEYKIANLSALDVAQYPEFLARIQAM